MLDNLTKLASRFRWLIDDYILEKPCVMSNQEKEFSANVIAAVKKGAEEGIKNFLSDPLIGQALAQYEVQNIVLDIVERAKTHYRERPQTVRTHSQ